MLILFGAILIYPFFYPFPILLRYSKVPVGVVDLDRSQLSRRLIRMMDAHEMLSVTARSGELGGSRGPLLQGDIKGIVVIPSRFERDIMKGRQARVAAYCDADIFSVTDKCSPAFSIQRDYVCGGCRQENDSKGDSKTAGHD